MKSYVILVCCIFLMSCSAAEMNTPKLSEIPSAESVGDDVDVEALHKEMEEALKTSNQRKGEVLKK